MYQISIDSIQKIIKLKELMDNIETKGYTNVSMLYSSMILLNEVIAELKQQSETKEK